MTERKQPPRIVELPDSISEDDGLTARQRTLFEFIVTSLRESGYPPSIREMGAAIGLSSSSSVAHQLKALEARGLVHRDPNRPRALEVNMSAAATTLPDNVVPLRPATVDVPVLGRIAAGSPILADEHVEDVLSLPPQLVGSGNVFALQVRGDSMIDAAICDGDYVVIRQQPTAENGEIVAALLGDEATVKTLHRTKGQVWLMPHNPAYQPIDGNEATIMGKVVAVLRRM
ncbi:MAG: transcriptional repressor LexA [Propionibacteriaceae bacterium]|jgi:repressor LexA|nr:transcriptional repressor LexA [Propionibacteriaceae bacterium]